MIKIVVERAQIGQREGEAALKKPVTFVRLRLEPGVLGRLFNRGTGVMRGAAAGGCSYV